MDCLNRQSRMTGEYLVGPLFPSVRIAFVGTKGSHTVHYGGKNRQHTLYRWIGNQLSVRLNRPLRGGRGDGLKA